MIAQEADKTHMYIEYGFPVAEAFLLCLGPARPEKWKVTLVCHIMFKTFSDSSQTAREIMYRD